MKLISFKTEDHLGYGILSEEKIFVLAPPIFPATLLELICSNLPLLKLAQEALDGNTLPSLPLSSARLMAPITNPGKIVAIGLNYLDHCREQNIPAPTVPIVFTKFTTAIIGPGDTIRWDPTLTDQVDYEVELAVVMGRTARNVSVEDALRYVFGYTVINDVSARDLQFSDKQWVRAKSLDTFCPCGPCITTADEIPDPQTLRLSTTLNGQKVQDSTTAEMAFGVAELIHRLSHSFTLMPGDVISTGTPDGVGVFRKPPIFLKNGDHVIVEVEKIGRLENPIIL
jgi:2-keto-4-pentenoate hydratase/2-oxohepta-3-ene-1,7-dioic acid hydratase in catechol pathway